MGKTRRYFLHAATVAAAVALTSPLRAAGTAPAAKTQIEPNYDAFVPLLASNFLASQEGKPAVTLRLVTVERATTLGGYPDPVAAARNSFTLTLRSEQPAALKEGIYTFTHPRLGAFSAFISPVTSNPRVYQIVYNRNPG